MRFAYAIALALMTGCSEPSVDLHLIRAASGPLHGQSAVESPCEDCRIYSWVGHDGIPVEISAERSPALSIPLDQLVDAERSRGSGLYRPFCDLYAIAHDSRMTPEESDALSLAYPGAAFAAVVRDEVLDAGFNVFQAGRLFLAFTSAERAERAAHLIGISPDFAIAEDPDRREFRESRAALFRSLSTEELAELAEQSGLDPHETTAEKVIDATLCP
ncbi:MAG: hypothetical protein R3F21_05710 [Myxococcota bacterium]